MHTAHASVKPVFDAVRDQLGVAVNARTRACMWNHTNTCIEATTHRDPVLEAVHDEVAHHRVVAVKRVATAAVVVVLTTCIGVCYVCQQRPAALQLEA